MTKEDLKKLFRVAVAIRGMTQSQFARNIGVQPSSVSEVISGQHKSQWIADEVEKFVVETLALFEKQKSQTCLVCSGKIAQ